MGKTSRVWIPFISSNNDNNNRASYTNGDQCHTQRLYTAQYIRVFNSPASCILQLIHAILRFPTKNEQPKPKTEATELKEIVISSPLPIIKPQISPIIKRKPPPIPKTPPFTEIVQARPQNRISVFDL